MGTHNLPRDVTGEGRILFIFSKKALIFSCGGALFGLLFYLIFSVMGLTVIGIIFVLIFAGIGFGIATLKIPNAGGFPITKKINRRKYR